jgi:predicted phosphodiesterase
LSEGWADDVVRMREKGASWRETAMELRRLHPDVADGLDDLQLAGKCRTAVDTWRRRNRAPDAAPVRPMPGRAPEQKAPKILDALKRGGTAQELAGRLGVSPRVAEAMVRDARDSGYNIQEGEDGYRLSYIAPPQDNMVKADWSGEKVLRLGLLGDTHLGCVDAQITHLHELYDVYQREGVTQVYHAGDLTDGEKMRAGHEYEIYVHGADAQVEHAVRVYPKRPGITTRFITGNHDYSFIKTIGLDIGRQVAALRTDMVYLGYMSAQVELSPGCTLELRHPQDGTAYSLSYKPQKIVEAMSGGEKPHILAIGHYHKTEYLFYRNVHILQAGTLCAQTHWMRGKGIAAAMGGWIIEAHVDDEGTVTRIKPEFIPYYKVIKEDWKGWVGTMAMEANHERL